jgi:site-specific recombinase XerD
VRAMMSTLGEQAGLDRRVHPHMLRHTYATRALDSGLTIREVQTLLATRPVWLRQIYIVEDDCGHP